MIPFCLQFIRERIDLEALMLLTDDIILIMIINVIMIMVMIMIMIVVIIRIMIPLFLQFIRERIDLEALMLLSEADLGEVRFTNYAYDDTYDVYDDEYDLGEVCFTNYDYDDNYDDEYDLGEVCFVYYNYNYKVLIGVMDDYDKDYHMRTILMRTVFWWWPKVLGMQMHRQDF